VRDRFARTFKYVAVIIFIMPRKKRRAIPQNPLLIGLSAFIAVLLITSASFNTPLVFISTSSGKPLPLSFSLVGLPLLAVLLFAVVYIRVRK
jgi:hypothetical protein